MRSGCSKVTSAIDGPNWPKTFNFLSPNPALFHPTSHYGYQGSWFFRTGPLQKSGRIASWRARRCCW